MSGYTGKILHLDLTRLKAGSIPTEKYRRWGGGHGMASALFWDYCKDKTITDGRNPANVVCIMTSPFCGTMVPSGGGRCEITGVGVGQYPVSWYTRSNFGGRFSAMLKYAGWDGIVIEGKAASPVWIDIRNGRVTFRDARPLWGQGTWSTQQEIWRLIGTGSGAQSQWKDISTTVDEGRSSQKPAVLAVGPAGENQTCHGSLVHDAGNGAGQGGFGAVWGSKNLKAISVLGTGAVAIADPTALLQTRFAARANYASNPDSPDLFNWSTFGKPPRPILFSPAPGNERRPQACQGCISGCRNRYKIGYGNESSCQETTWYWNEVNQRYEGEEAIKINLRAVDLIQQYGFNSYPIMHGLRWLEHLYEEGILGPDAKIRSDLPWKSLGSYEFAEALIHQLSNRESIGADLADGWVQAAQKWGRQQDLDTGVLSFPYWGMPEHGYDPRAELEWGYGSILGDRDTNMHDFNFIFWHATLTFAKAVPFRIEAEQMVRTVAAKLSPYAKDMPEALDFSTANMYSKAVAQLVRWHQHYGRFWKQSALLCDLRWPDLFNTNRPDLAGITGSPEAGEQVFWKAVTGEALTLEEGIEIGRQIWNLDNAIWTLQGRHRDMVHFAPYIYDTDFTKGKLLPFYLWPTRDADGTWRYNNIMGRRLDRQKFDDWKNLFYELEGWDPATGWPTRETLDAMEMGFVAEALEDAGKIGVQA